MRVAFLIKILCCTHTEKITYETLDKFIEFSNDDETLEIKIMKKYPGLNNIDNCCDCVVFDKFTKEKYLIVSNII